jgi:L-iditol 2-dehydrogenase
MKAAMFKGPQDLSVIDVDLPKIKDDEILIKVYACATCGTDAKIFHHGHQRLTPPQIIGHEIAGQVTEIGKNITKTKVGDRVQVIAAIPCGDCWTCNQGKMTICRNQLSMGYQFPGGFAEYMIIPKEVVVVDGVNRIPDNVSYDEASVTEPLACAINAQELVKVTKGDVVLVMGAGPIGCLHVQLARANGATKVFLADINAGRLKLSADVVKPDVAIDMSKEDIVKKSLELTDGIGPTVVITAAPAGQAQEQAISLVAPGGRISFFGGLPKDKPFINCDSNLVHYKELFLVGANGSSPQHNKMALEMISSGKVRVNDLITHRVPLSEVNKAIEAVLSGEAIKVVINPNS